ncbi:MAG: hypothetical protein ABEK36_05300 [Candidatus Aenigmatarchaeota archaeon]
MQNKFMTNLELYKRKMYLKYRINKSKNNNEREYWKICFFRVQKELESRKRELCDICNKKGSYYSSDNKILCEECFNKYKR